VPDTARTLAAIQALFADNSTGGISAQDLRDAMQSVATPVIGGGFDSDPTNWELLASWSGADQSIAENVIVPVTFDTTRDPQSWAGASPLASDYLFGNPTFPAGSWFTLPRGYYSWFARGFWASKPSLGWGAIELMPMILSEVGADDVWGMWGNTPAYSLKQFNFAQRRGTTEEAGGTMRVSALSMRFGIVAEHVSTTLGTLGLGGTALHIMRMG